MLLLYKNIPSIKPFSAKPIKWPNKLEQFVDDLLSVFDHFVGLALKEI